MRMTYFITSPLDAPYKYGNIIIAEQCDQLFLALSIPPKLLHPQNSYAPSNHGPDTSPTAAQQLNPEPIAAPPVRPLVALPSENMATSQPQQYLLQLSGAELCR